MSCKGHWTEHVVIKDPSKTSSWIQSLVPIIIFLDITTLIFSVLIAYENTKQFNGGSYSYHLIYLSTKIVKAIAH